MQVPPAASWEGLLLPALKSAVPANFPAVPLAAAIFVNHLKLQ